MTKYTRLTLKIILWVTASCIALLLLLFILIRIPAVQNFAVQKAINYLETKIGTKVSLNRVSLDLPKVLVLEGIYFEDQMQDTLFSGDSLRVDINLVKLLNNTVEINSLDFRGITAHIHRSLPDSAFNFDYIMAAFSDPAAEKQDTSSTPMVFSMDKIKLERIKILYKDDVIGTSANVYIGHLDTRIKTFDLEKMQFDVPKITAYGVNTAIKQWGVASASNLPDAASLGLQQAVQEEELLKLNLGKLDLKKFDIHYDDSDSEMVAKIIFQNLQLTFNELNLPKEQVDIQKLVLEGADASIRFAKNNSTSDTTTSDSESPINWIVKANDIKLKNNRLAFDDDNFPILKKGMDYSHLQASSVNLTMDQLYFSMDSIQGEVNSLSFKEKSGLELRKLQTLFRYTDQGASLQNLYLETPHSLFRDYLKVSYQTLENALEHPENLAIEASLKNSTLGMVDVLLLVPDLDTMQVMQPLLSTSFFLNGKIKGKMDQLTIPSFTVKTLDHTRLSLSGRISGMPDIDQLQLNLNIQELVSTRKDLDRLVDKSLLPDSIALPENIHLSGTFIGGMKGFNTDLKLNSSIGDAEVAGKFILGKTDTLYDARINIAHVDLGNLMQDTTLGQVSFSANVKGKGLDPATANADIQAELIQADFMNYTYTGISLQAQAANGDIQATLLSNDPNLKLKGDIKADMRGTYPKLSLSLQVDSIHLKNLHVTSDEIKYHGLLEADFSTADPDYLNGQASISQSVLAYNGKAYPIDSISLTSEANDEFKFINLESGFLNAHIMGNYTLTELPIALQDILQVYYNPENTIITQSYTPQTFEFSAELNRSPLIRDLFKDLTEMKNITFDGNFSSVDRSINARIAAPHTVYSGILVDSVAFDLNTADSTFYYSGRVGEVSASTLQIINTLISGTLKENLLDFGLWIKDAEEKEQYHLGASMLAENKDFILKLKEDGLILNFEKWKISPENQVLFGEQGVHVQDFSLENNHQTLFANSANDSLNAPINISFNDFRIETFTKFLESSTLKLGGGINGTVLLDRMESSPVFESDITVNSFYFGNDTLGNINMQVDNKRENVYAANVTISGNENDINLNGEILSPPQGASNLDFELNLNKLNMTSLEAFSFGYLQHSKGSMNGKLHITGSSQAPLINGDLLFNKAETNISMLNAPFIFDEQKISFTQEGIQFNRFEIADNIGNKATLNGRVKTKNYLDYALDLTLASRNFQVVNSTAPDNDLFFGKLFLTSDLRIKGAALSPVIDGTIKVNENTNLTINYTEENPGLVEREGIVEFIDKKKEGKAQVFAQKDSVAISSVTGMDMSFNIEVDPKATFNVIIDGDAVTAKGKAELTAGIDPSGEMSLAGTYEVSEGSYNLSLDFIKKKFDFRNGSTITWSGDPFSADLNITADYLIKASPIDLVENQLGGENTSVYKEKLPFQVNLFIKGDMMSPRLSFGIDIDEDNASVSQDVMSMVNTRIAQISENESELNKQVFALIVLGRFVAENPFSSSAGGNVESMARESVSKLLSSQLNRLAGDLIEGVELNFDLEATDDYSTGSLQSRTDLNLGVSKRLLDDRLKITIGNNFQLEGANQPGRQQTNIAGDITIDYQLSRDGRYLLRAFRKNDYEVTLQGQVIETGLGFIINMNYDVFKELFLNASSLTRFKQRQERRNRLKYMTEEELKAFELERQKRREAREKLQKEKQEQEANEKDHENE